MWLLLAKGCEVGGKITEEIETTLGVGNVFKHRKWILRTDDRPLPEGVTRTRNLAESMNPAPYEESLGAMTIELGDGHHQAAEAPLFEGVNGDQRIAGSNKNIEFMDESFEPRWVSRLWHGCLL
jgi:hypothetical protein